VQQQLAALLKCDVSTSGVPGSAKPWLNKCDQQVMDNDPENEITVTVFRLLVLDLLALFQALNQGMINILGRWSFMFAAVISC